MSSQLLDVPYKHSSSIWSFADNALTATCEAVLTAGYSPVTNLAEKAMVSYVSLLSHMLSLPVALILTGPSVLKNITVGHLRIVTDKRTYDFPAHGTDTGYEEPHAELRVINDAFWVRLCTMGALGFAEAYMFGDIICEDLISIFLVSTVRSPSLPEYLNRDKVFLENQKNLTSLNSTVSWLFSLPQRLSSFRFLNSLGNARSNISSHYDLSDDMFKGLKPILFSCDCADSYFHLSSLSIGRYDILVCHLF